MAYLVGITPRERERKGQPMQTSDAEIVAREEAKKYRQAAEETLDQLQWCITYFHKIGKSPIADVIANNHRIIRSRMRDRT